MSEVKDANEATPQAPERDSKEEEQTAPVKSEEGNGVKEEVKEEKQTDSLVAKTQEENEIDVSEHPGLPEVALILWVLKSSQHFRLTEFTLATLENGLRSPEMSDVMTSVHSVLLAEAKELRAAAQKKPRGVIIKKPYEWWTAELCATIRGWIDDRRDLAYRLRLIEESEDDYVYDEEDTLLFYRESIELLDEYLAPIISGPIPEKEDPPEMDLSSSEEEDDDEEDDDNDGNEGETERKDGTGGNGSVQGSVSSSQRPRKKETRRERDARMREKRLRLKERLRVAEEEQEQEANRKIEAIMPFDGPHGYLCISPLKRLACLRSLVLWRAAGFPREDLLDTVRLFDEETLRVEPLGYDIMGRRYWYFAQFHNDCRVYRETLGESDESRELEAQKRKKAEAERLKKEAEEAKKRIEEAEAEKARLEKAKNSKKRKGGPEDDDDDENDDNDGGRSRRTSSRRRSQVQRYGLDGSNAPKRKRKKRSAYVDGSSDEESTTKAQAVKKGKRGRRGAVKKKKNQTEEEPVNEIVSLKPKVSGAEPPAKSWELVVTDLESLQELVADLKSLPKELPPKKKIAPDAHEELVTALDEIAEHVEEEAENMRKAKAKLERMERIFTLPRKKSSRVAALEEKKEREQELARQHEEKMAALERENRENRRRQAARERERRREEEEERQRLETEARRAEQERKRHGASAPDKDSPIAAVPDSVSDLAPTEASAPATSTPQAALQANSSVEVGSHTTVPQQLQAATKSGPTALLFNESSHKPASVLRQPTTTGTTTGTSNGYVPLNAPNHLGMAQVPQVPQIPASLNMSGNTPLLPSHTSGVPSTLQPFVAASAGVPRQIAIPAQAPITTLSSAPPAVQLSGIQSQTGFHAPSVVQSPAASSLSVSAGVGSQPQVTGLQTNPPLQAAAGNATMPSLGGNSDASNVGQQGVAPSFGQNPTL